MTNKKDFLASINKEMQAVGFNLVNETVENIPFQNAIIADCNMSCTIFFRCDLSRLYDNTFENCLFVECEGYKGEIYRNSFVNCSFHNCNFRKAHFNNHGPKGTNELKGIIENTVFFKCDFTYGFFSSSKLSNVIFNQCKIKEKIDDKNEISNINFIDCTEEE